MGENLVTMTENEKVYKSNFPLGFEEEVFRHVKSCPIPNRKYVT